MRRTLPITAEQASLPASIPAVQRSLPGEVVYPFFTWCGDRWAGWRDRRGTAAMLDKDKALGVSPWMDGLKSGFLSAVARDRRETTALQVPLRDRAAKAIARYNALGDKIEGLQSNVEQATRITVSDEPTSVGETHEKPEQIKRRRQSEADSRLAAARSRLDQAGVERQEILMELGELEESFNFLEAAYTYRVEALRNYYAKRQAVYIRSGVRAQTRDGEPAVAPVIEAPDWHATPLPKPESVNT
ncbi:MAG: hypothetical protein LBR21_03760 [Propionibacteriaceae bacterium]|jgi:hypothetical protein|nr:hypothetical protein [Propionibacteriaceae bacterium]